LGGMTKLIPEPAANRQRERAQTWTQFYGRYRKPPPHASSPLLRTAGDGLKESDVTAAQSARGAAREIIKKAMRQAAAGEPAAPSFLFFRRAEGVVAEPVAALAIQSAQALADGLRIRGLDHRNELQLRLVKLGRGRFGLVEMLPQFGFGARLAGKVGIAGAGRKESCELRSHLRREIEQLVTPSIAASRVPFPFAKSLMASTACCWSSMKSLRALIAASLLSCAVTDAVPPMANNAKAPAAIPALRYFFIRSSSLPPKR